MLNAGKTSEHVYTEHRRRTHITSLVAFLTLASALRAHQRVLKRLLRSGGALAALWSSAINCMSSERRIWSMLASWIRHIAWYRRLHMATWTCTLIFPPLLSI